MKLEDKLGLTGLFCMAAVGFAMFMAALFDLPVLFIRLFVGAIGVSILVGAAVAFHHILKVILSENRK